MANITKRVGKGSKMESLPSRFALATVTKGDPVERSMNDYAKCPEREPPELPGSTSPMREIPGYFR